MRYRPLRTRRRLVGFDGADFDAEDDCALIPPLLGGRLPGRAWAVIVIVAGALALAGCGGGGSATPAGSPSTTTASPGGAGGGSSGSGLQGFVNCLRQHGVELPAGFSGGSIPQGGPGGSLPSGLGSNPGFRACQSQLPSGAGQKGVQALSAFTSCMSQHGVTLTTTAGGFPTGLGSLDRSSAAYKTCSALLPSASGSTSPTP